MIILLFLPLMIFYSEAKPVRLTQSYCERLIEKYDSVKRYHVGSKSKNLPATLDSGLNMSGSMTIGGTMGSSANSALPSISIQGGSPVIGSQSPNTQNVSTRIIGNNNNPVTTTTITGTATAGAGGVGTGGAGGVGGAVGGPGGAGGAGVGGGGGSAAVQGGAAASNNSVSAATNSTAVGNNSTVASGSGVVAGQGSIVAGQGGTAVSIQQNGVTSTGPSGVISTAPLSGSISTAAQRNEIPIMDDTDKYSVLDRCRELY